MSFHEAVSYLDALGVDHMRSRGPSTHRIEALLELLDHPERAVSAIHITGTNGKTSVAHICTSLLRSSGLKVGTYTSPHLQTVTERISLDGAPIDEHSFGELFAHVRPYLDLIDDRVSYFELLTGMFFLWAADNADAAVVEVGLGGRWDATNALTAAVAVITNIGLEHTELLGSTTETIAKEKVGIIKPGSSVVTAERSPTVLRVISDEAASQGADLAAYERDFSVLDNRVAFGGRYVALQTSRARYDDLFMPLHGSHQGINAAVALEAVTRFLPAQALATEVVQEGLAQAVVPGRLESLRLAHYEVTVVLDVAHNPDGMAALVNGLAEAFVFDELVVVVGVLADKDYRGMLAELARLPCTLVVTQPQNARSVTPSDLGETAAELGLEYEIVSGVAAAVDAAIGSAGEGRLVCVTGSHYVVGEARRALLDQPS
ncbi:MAG: Mur ligase family protein [Actinomycetota bacterium]|nr:Mur ligase family protein [Actinomycetota bacterium]